MEVAGHVVYVEAGIPEGVVGVIVSIVAVVIDTLTAVIDVVTSRPRSSLVFV